MRGRGRLSPSASPNRGILPRAKAIRCVLHSSPAAGPPPPCSRGCRRGAHDDFVSDAPGLTASRLAASARARLILDALDLQAHGWAMAQDTWAGPQAQRQSATEERADAGATSDGGQSDTSLLCGNTGCPDSPLPHLSRWLLMNKKETTGEECGRSRCVLRAWDALSLLRSMRSVRACRVPSEVQLGAFHIKRTSGASIILPHHASSHTECPAL